jgi:hypothetical protein
MFSTIDLAVYWRQVFIGRVFLLEEYGRAQSSSVSPRGGGYCSSASTPHSSNGGSYGGNMNGYGGATPTSTAQLSNMLPSSPSAGIFNSTPSEFFPPTKNIVNSVRSDDSSFTLFWIVILVSSEAGHYHFGAHNSKAAAASDKEKSAFAPVIRGSATPPTHPPAPALFHHQPVTGWHHLAVQWMGLVSSPFASMNPFALPTCNSQGYGSPLVGTTK